MGSLVIPILDNNINKNGFILTASSTDSTGQIYGPFNNKINDKWIASTGNLNEYFKIESLYPITVNAFAITSNLSSFQLLGSSDNLNYMTLYNSSNDSNYPISPGIMYYCNNIANASWTTIKILNTSIIPNDEKCTISFFQCFS